MNYLSAMLGFPDGILSEPFSQYVAEALQESESLFDIRGAFCFPEKSEFVANNSQILIDGIEFEIGKAVAKELRNATFVALFICKAGEGIGRCSQELLTGENPVPAIYVVRLNVSTEIIKETSKKFSSFPYFAIQIFNTNHLCK